MEIKTIGSRGVLYTFSELDVEPYFCTTNVYVIVGKKDFYICDTYLGPFYMKKIKAHLTETYGIKNYIIFNSHSHWDHVWGNSEFKGCKIIAHDKCKTLLSATGLSDLALLKDDFAKEAIEIVLPNCVFKTKLNFDNDGLVFFYSPGHSIDSASCYDKIDQTLFVGDNIDDPIPSAFDWHNLTEYRETLIKYLLYDLKLIVQSHGDVMLPSVIQSNIDYLDNLLVGTELSFNNPETEKKHKENLRFLAND